MDTPDIIEVTEATFEYDVVAFSQNTPVVVDFWAEWCKPCKTMGVILENLAIEFAGGFRLARVNIEQNPNLAIRFGVRSIPTVKAFVNTQVVKELVGQQDEQRVRDFLSQIAPPSPIMLMAEKGEAMLRDGKWAEAQNVFDELIRTDPENSRFKLGFGIALLGLGKPYQSRDTLESIKSGREFNRAKTILELVSVQCDLLESKLSTESDIDLAFSNCIKLSLRLQLDAALDGLIDIIRQEKNYKNGLARKVYLAILEVLFGSEEKVRKYRSDLASALY